MFYLETVNGKRILKSDLIKGANAFFTTREFCLCNKKELTEEEENIIKEDRKIIADYLKIKEENLLSPVQTHSYNIEVADINKKNYPDCDGLIVTDERIGVFLNYADCTPVILYDEEENKSIVVTIEQIAQKGYDLSPNKYVTYHCLAIIRQYLNKWELYRQWHISTTIRIAIHDL